MKKITEFFLVSFGCLIGITHISQSFELRLDDALRRGYYHNFLIVSGILHSDGKMGGSLSDNDCKIDIDERDLKEVLQNYLQPIFTSDNNFIHIVLIDSTNEVYKSGKVLRASYEIRQSINPDPDIYFDIELDEPLVLPDGETITTWSGAFWNNSGSILFNVDDIVDTLAKGREIKQFLQQQVDSYLWSNESNEHTCLLR